MTQQRIAIDRQEVEGTSRVRVYASQVQLAEKDLPPILFQAQAVWHWSFLRAQRRVSEGVAQTVVGADGQLHKVTRECEEHPILEALRSIDGVEFVDAAGYTLLVYKAATFDWAPIEDAIRRLVATFSLPLERVGREEEGA